MLKAGTKLLKKTGHPGPVRTVTQVLPASGLARLTWERTTAREGAVTMATWVQIEADGLPAGYVLAKDRAAKKAGAK